MDCSRGLDDGSRVIDYIRSTILDICSVMVTYNIGSYLLAGMSKQAFISILTAWAILDDTTWDMHYTQESHHAGHRRHSNRYGHFVVDQGC